MARLTAQINQAPWGRLRRQQRPNIAEQQDQLAALDAMRWHTGYVVTGYGVRIGVRVNRAALARQLQQRVTPGTRIAANPSGGLVSRIVSFVDGGSRSSADTPRYNVHANGGLVSRADDVTIIHDAYDTQLRVAFAEFSTRKLFIHAGVVGWRGRAIVIPGRSLAGKTTLTAALVRAGATYFSDEYAVLDARGRVHPFAKPLSVRATPTARQVETPVESIGGHAATASLPVGLVLSTQFKKGSQWQPQTLSVAAATVQLLANTVAAQLRTADAVKILGDLAHHAPAIQSDRPTTDCVIQFLNKNI